MCSEIVKKTAEELCDVRDQIKALQEREKELAGALKTAFSGPIKMVAGNVLVELTSVKGRVTYDYKSMLDDGMNLEPYKKVGKESLRISVKRMDVIT